MARQTRHIPTVQLLVASYPRDCLLWGQGLVLTNIVLGSPVSVYWKLEKTEERSKETGKGEDIFCAELLQDLVLPPASRLKKSVLRDATQRILLATLRDAVIIRTRCVTPFAFRLFIREAWPSQSCRQ